MEILNDVDVDLAQKNDLCETLKKVIDMFTQKTQNLKRFGDKHAVKPNPWDGEKEE